MSHTLKKTTNPRKYKCKICSVVLDRVHELTTHHQTNHNILYCSTCKRAFNNPLSLSRHEYKHKHKDLQCPKCDRTFTFESQVKAHMFSHHTNPSLFCVHPNCDKAFFNESDLTRHSKRHNGKYYQCLDCTKTLIKGTMIPMDSATAGLPNISAKLAVRSLCSIARKGETSRMASAPSNILNHLHSKLTFHVEMLSM